MRRRYTPPAPLERGDFGAAFLVGNGWVGCGGFPSREGIEWCVMVKVAAKADGLRDTVSRRLVLQGGICQTLVVALDLGSCARASHTPSPSQEGRFGMLFSCC